MKGWRALYSGKVQGVGFRWTTRDLANGFEVSGTVRNLPDGRVELVVAGHEAEGFLVAIRESPLAGHIEKEEVEPIELPDPPKGFMILP